MPKIRVFVIRINVIEPLNVQDPDLALLESLNKQGIEVIGELPVEKFDTVLPLLEEPYTSGN